MSYSKSVCFLVLLSLFPAFAQKREATKDVRSKLFKQVMADIGDRKLVTTPSSSTRMKAPAHTR